MALASALAPVPVLAESWAMGPLHAGRTVIQRECWRLDGPQWGLTAAQARSPSLSAR